MMACWCCCVMSGCDGMLVLHYVCCNVDVADVRVCWCCITSIHVLHCWCCCVVLLMLGCDGVLHCWCCCVMLLTLGCDGVCVCAG